MILLRFAFQTFSCGFVLYKSNTCCRSVSQFLGNSKKILLLHMKQKMLLCRQGHPASPLARTELAIDVSGAVAAGCSPECHQARSRTEEVRDSRTEDWGTAGQSSSGQGSRAAPVAARGSGTGCRAQVQQGSCASAGGAAPGRACQHSRTRSSQHCSPCKAPRAPAHTCQLCVHLWNASWHS